MANAREIGNPPWRRKPDRAEHDELIWQHQPVPYALDDDPDWAAGAVVTLSSCGTLITSQQKDGWAWSVDAGTGHARWAFPTDPAIRCADLTLDQVLTS